MGNVIEVDFRPEPDDDEIAAEIEELLTRCDRVIDRLQAAVAAQQPDANATTATRHLTSAEYDEIKQIADACHIGGDPDACAELAEIQKVALNELARRAARR